VAFEQRPDASEQIKRVCSSSRRHAAEYTFCYQANIRRKVIVLQPVTLNRRTVSMCTSAFRRAVAATLCLAGFASSPSVFAQARPVPGVIVPAAQQSAAGGTQVRRLTADDAVRLAAENNLGIQIARFDPQIEDLGIAQTRAAYTPTFNMSAQQNSNTSPPNSFLSGAQNSLITDQFSTTMDIQKNLSWGGGNYAIGWDGARSTSNNFFTNFNPQLRSSLSMSFTQPLLRGFKIDSTRQQLQIGEKNREIADVGVRETLTATSRGVRNAYWDLAFQIAALQVAQQSLELAEESLRNTRARVDIGTTPPIDIVEADAEVWQRREAVIVAQAQIATAQDTLRALVYNPSMPDFWTIRIEPTDLPPFAPLNVDIDGAIRNALERRTDLQQIKKNIEATDVNIRFLRSESLPDVTARFDYGLSALGGVQFVRTPGAGLTPGDIIGEERRGFGSVLGDLFSNDFPTWTLGVNVSYPIGRSPQEANLARTRLQRTQTETQLRNQELQVVTQVRQVARDVTTNQQRVQTTRAARELQERRLEAEQRKFAAGTSTNFLVFQAQRDLAVARNNELRAILDYNQSLVDLETVQEIPLR
jgi:HAE1 family hydrophobic/amphiphilic exporter-1